MQSSIELNSYWTKWQIEWTSNNDWKLRTCYSKELKISEWKTSNICLHGVVQCALQKEKQVILSLIGSIDLSIRENLSPLEGRSRATSIAIYLGVGSLCKKSDLCNQSLWTSPKLSYHHKLGQQRAAKESTR